mgnify:FL=1|tara:strand:+ start:415 stop:642 length:228 start_codon:yes stop_codon:yes gene_type:complete
MPGIGISLATFPAAAAVAIEDYVWSISGNDLTPIPSIAYDFSDSWDVSSTELTPAVSPGEEGYWNVDANGDLTPK